jgi:hypothetical protein
MDNDEYHNITRRLVAIMANQDTINDRVAMAIDQLAHTTARLTVAIEDITTLIARNIPLSENGRNV